MKKSIFIFLIVASAFTSLTLSAFESVKLSGLQANETAMLNDLQQKKATVAKM